MSINRIAKTNSGKKTFELLQIRISFTDDVILTSQFVAMTAEV